MQILYSMKGKGVEKIAKRVWLFTKISELFCIAK